MKTKLYMPPPRPNRVMRPRLIKLLDDGMHRKLTLISASAGSGKTTAASDWLAGGARPVGWLSLDEDDNDSSRFLTYLILAIRTAAAHFGGGLFSLLQSSPSPPPSSLMTAILNELSADPFPFVLVLDDYHVIHSTQIHQAVALLIEHMPFQMQVVIVTREEPSLPLARWRARDHLSEIRDTDLRFSVSEAKQFLTLVMGLHLDDGEIARLESRTEGWIAGLQLAAISIKGQPQTKHVIETLSGSHHFVLDYLFEEVFQRQTEEVQAFMLRTSILDRMCGPLCDAVVGRTGSHETLAYLEKLNLFLIPLDDERQWYRYHHLFADMLRRRLSQGEDGACPASDLHIRASQWFESQGLEAEALHHASLGHDIERAARLIEGEGMPLHFRGAVTPVLNWMRSMPVKVFDERPTLWVIYASALLMVGQLSGVEPMLKSAEAALYKQKQDERTRDYIGHIASIRASLAVSRHDADTILAQSRRALSHLHPNNLPVRTATQWTLGYAYQLTGDRNAASQAYTEAVAMSERIGHKMMTITASIGLGNLQEADNRLERAAETYRRVLELAGDPPLPVACEAHLGLARIAYERNDLEAAAVHAELSVKLAGQFDSTDRVAASKAMLSCIMLAKGDVVRADELLVEASGDAHDGDGAYRMNELIAVRIRISLLQGNMAEAARLALETGDSLYEAKVCLAKGDASSALAVIKPFRKETESRGWGRERLHAMLLQALALRALGEKRRALDLLHEGIAIAKQEGFTRLFLDEGSAMAELLYEAAAQDGASEEILKLLALFEDDGKEANERSAAAINAHGAAGSTRSRPSLVEPLSRRELEVLRLIASGLSNREIGERLYLALSTVKGYNRTIFDKLQVRRRTEAVARARELGLL